jgi:methionyl-tRNA formyltransferase
VTVPARAVVFAYHDVGAACLRVLARHGLDIPLVVTHRDDPREAQWFARVADVAAGLGLVTATPDDPNAAAFVARVAALAPDFIFSFYYRRMLAPALLDTARRGALNMHGSLLPRYRGRAPVNWAVLNGETETGATLHYMVAQPDAGDIVARRAVPIGPDDTARDVFDQVTAAAAALLDDVLPALLEGRAPRLPNDVAAGSYFGGRTADDGRIDLQWPAHRVHDLVRAVAPPYPGAFIDLPGGRLRVLRTRRLDVDPPAAPAEAGLYIAGDRLYARCGDGASVAILEAEHAGQRVDARIVATLLATAR